MKEGQSPVIETQLEGLTLLRRGKVRDVYELDENRLLIVASDRISAFDVVMEDPIPDKGRILTEISLFWLRYLEPWVKTHLIGTEVSSYPPSCRPFASLLEGRSMLVWKARPLSVECIARGYLAGSGWEDYKKTGTVCGIPLPGGLRESDRLPEPIFTPSTKAEAGMHDENITFAQAGDILGPELAEQVQRLTLLLYEKGRDYAGARGIIVADTKFEFGIHQGQLMLIDEALTPDSSRFWPVDTYHPGKSQKSFDKQFLRDYLLSIRWPKTPPPPRLPPEVIRNTREKYLEALERLTGKGLSPLGH